MSLPKTVLWRWCDEIAAAYNRNIWLAEPGHAEKTYVVNNEIVWWLKVTWPPRDVSGRRYVPGDIFWTASIGPRVGHPVDMGTSAITSDMLGVVANGEVTAEALEGWLTEWLAAVGEIVTEARFENWVSAAG